ncbi:GlxA family transcriptional regulator [Actibacterium pelagium]|uniref:AraC family transcriptional regulator n=1 Tax=Actibacterium pelagium TaxID=2029103 RepID=A0A917AMK4_9RHOB|nr:GlxA family transcriptional regulator [Actibacterium pelagium]GGE62068.1 AraC family transcriptional regulator [Actibacterium pelagium]
MAATIAFLMLPDFALLSASSAIEPLRAANGISGEHLYDICYVSAQGGLVRSSCGGLFETIPMADLPEDTQQLFVVAGGNPFQLNTRAEAAFLRQRARHGLALGGISGGSIILARAGLLENRRCTVHWEHMQAMREEFPDLLLEKRLFVLDRDRATCAGGIAPLDMMHALIRADHGAGLAAAVSDWFIHTRVRLADEAQRLAETEETSLHPVVGNVLRLMDDHIADPLSVEQLARLSGVSARQLQRYFHEDLNCSVVQHYSRLRLAKADELLRQTKLSVAEISEVVGFSNQSNFARAFREVYHVSPRKRRQEI